ncbi:MAG: prepilin-type N-terminal cleavage/methylation domain-containing protein [Nitrospirota bacterium]
MLKQLKQLKGQKGFTLIELMIVVAIIGILAAIAIPNFLTYQLKSRQAEAKTNLQAIKTSEVAFQAERGCYLGVAVEAGQPLAGATKTAPWPWGVGQPASAPVVTGWCTAAGVGGTSGVFTDIGFKATGNVMYVYGADARTVGAPGLYTTAVSCGLYAGATGSTGLSAMGNNNFVAVAKVNLDGDAVISTWNSTVDHGANDCTTGVY